MIGNGSGKINSSASGWYLAKAKARPRIAPDAPMKGGTGRKAVNQSASEKTAAPMPQ